MRLDSWLPTTTGADYQLSSDAELAPLLGLKDYVSVVSGLAVKTPYHSHHSGMATICTGGPHLKLDDVRDTIVSTFKYPSVDQIAADHFMQSSPTPYRSLELAVTRFRGTDEGTERQANGEARRDPGVDRDDGPEGGTAGNADDAGLGQRIAQVSLQRRAGHPECGTNEHAEQCARQADLTQNEPCLRAAAKAHAGRPSRERGDRQHEREAGKSESDVRRRELPHAGGLRVTSCRRVLESVSIASTM